MIIIVRSVHLLHQARSRLRAAGWRKVPEWRTTSRCWSGRAVRAWRPGSSTLWREVVWSVMTGRTEEKRSTGARDPNISMIQHNLPRQNWIKMYKADILINRRGLSFTILCNTIVLYNNFIYKNKHICYLASDFHSIYFRCITLLYVWAHFFFITNDRNHSRLLLGPTRKGRKLFTDAPVNLRNLAVCK